MVLGQKSVISISLSPNIEPDDIQLCFRLIKNRRNWKQGEAIHQLEETFQHYFQTDYAVSFNSGRSAFLAILEALDIKEGDEIILQAFTCNAAVNPILARKAKPVYADIDKTLNLDPDDLKKKITKNTKAVIIQHTFGWPAQIDRILKIAKENNLYLIEDCAHSLGAKFKGKLCGTFGDASFFSFGRDKIISSVFGGMAITKNKEIGERIKNFQESLSFPSDFWIFQQLLHPILINYLVLPAYGINQYLGRFFLGFFHQTAVLSKGVYKKEKKGIISRHFPKKFPDALAVLALNQFQKLERFNQHRRETAKIYQENLKKKFKLPLARSEENIVPTFMRYPILTEKETDEILKKARKRKIYLNDGWRKSPIVPPDTDLEKMKYPKGSCPKAEKVAKRIINLPTHINISQEDAQKIINLLSDFSS